MSNLTCEINGVKYVLIEKMATHKIDIDKFEAYLLKNDCILQSSRIERPAGFWGDKVAVFSLLIPEKIIIDFNAQKFNRY